MFEYKQILDVLGRKILDSSGCPAIEAEVLADDGTIGRASVPLGIEKSERLFAEAGVPEHRQLLELEAIEAVHHINTVLADAIIGENVLQQSHIDRILLRAEGTYPTEGFCRRAVLAVSLAAARAAAECLGMPLYRYLGGMRVSRMPVLQMCFTVKKAGILYAEEAPEIFVVPVKGMNYRDAVKMGAVGFMQYQSLLEENAVRNDFENIQDKGDGEDTLNIVQCRNEERKERQEDLQRQKDGIRAALRKAGYRQEKDFTLALKISGDLPDDTAKDTNSTPEHMDDFGEQENNGCFLEIQKADTVTGLMEQANSAHAGMRQICVDATGGKTDDPVPVELSFAMGAKWLRLGAPGNPECIACYNQLLRIGEML